MINLNPVKTFFEQFKAYLWAFVMVVIAGQAFYIWLDETRIDSLKEDLKKSHENYNILLSQHKNLADAVSVQNRAIDKMKIDEVKAEKQFKADKIKIKNTYDALVAKYKDTPQNKKCAIILERNRKYYEEDRGVGHEEN